MRAHTRAHTHTQRCTMASPPCRAPLSTFASHSLDSTATADRVRNLRYYIHSLSLDTLSLTKSSIPFRPLKARSASCIDFSVFFRSRHVRKSNIGERTGSTVTKNTYTLRTELSTVVTLPLAAPHDGHCHTLEGAARATSMALTMLTQITQS